ncbi:unnamed protein product [Phaedon cochleariae]|uniref:CCHC-type domain-containing protein n=1 Tax=Phaedon cochleariae TaxID=80249 RepID=A0A9N9SJ86_PHACE|nr:unnamed protein product [Phaedon cochleariae]
MEITQANEDGNSEIGSVIMTNMDSDLQAKSSSQRTGNNEYQKASISNTGLEATRVSSESLTQFSEAKETLINFLSSSKESINRKKVATEALETMTSAFTELMTYITQKATERRVTEELVTLHDKLNSISEKIDNIKKPTYAEKVGSNLNLKSAKIPLGNGKLANPSTDSTILIYLKEGNQDCNSSEDTLSTLKSLRADLVGIKAKKLLPIANNGVKIIAAEANLNKKALDEAGLTSRMPPKFKPRMAVIGVPSDWNATRTENKINDDLEIPVDHQQEVKAHFKFGKRDAQYVTWIIECDHEMRTDILERGRLYLGWVACQVRDHVRIVRCYNCQNYGHLASKCRNKTSCGICSKEHPTKECNKEDKKCINCKINKMPEEDCAHEANDINCPTYNKRIRSYISNIDYGT